MDAKLRILILEDTAADVVRVNHELRKAGLHFRSKRVETKADFLNELQFHTPDLILSDHGLPSFDGFTALAMTRARCPDTPFIFVSAAVGELMAIEMLRSGATDCVLKERLGDLAPAVHRALREVQDRARGRVTDAEMRGNEQRFRMVLEELQDLAVALLDWEGCVTFWNAGAELVYGWRAEETRGRSFAVLYGGTEIATGKPQLDLETAARTGRFEDHGPRVGKGGQAFMADVILTPFRDAQDRLRGFVHVTHRGETGLVLARYRAIVASAMDAIVSVDANQTIQDFNAAAEKMFHCSAAEAVGKSLDQFIPPRSREAHRKHVKAFGETGITARAMGHQHPVAGVRATGEEFPIEASISQVEAGGRKIYTAILRDITERQQSEAALRESEERFRLLVEGVQDHELFMLDPDGRVTTWNAGAERIRGYPAREIIGQPFAVFFTPEDVARGVPRKLLQQAENEGRAVHEGVRVRKSGERFWIQGVISALRDASGKLLGFCKLARDVTRQKMAEDTIRELNEQLERRVALRTAQLEAANKELEAFSYSVSHDLRAPLLHIRGFVDMLEQEAAPQLSEQSLKHLQIISEGARRMNVLIEALLHFSRLGRAEMQFEEVDMAQLFEEAKRELGRDIAGRAIEWTLGAVPKARGDPLMLRQVIINLLSNALKFTRTRTPARIEFGGKIEGNDTIYCFRDNGVGFDMDYMGKLFGVFQRLHAARDFEGTGIGLANVRRTIQRHGGRVWAEGRVDQGATFYFSIPRPPKGST